MRIIRADELEMGFGGNDASWTSHAISQPSADTIRGDANRELIDTNWPLVRRVGDAAGQLQSEGRHVLLIGKHGHDEVRDIVDDLDSFDVIANAADVRTYESQQLGIVSQPTMPLDVVTEVCSFIQLLNPLADIRFVDTACDPTKRRQQAMDELVSRVDEVVVVGGCNSNNARRLVQVCHDHGTPALHVEGAEDIDAEWFRDVGIVGLTADPSTLVETANRVHDALKKIAHALRQLRSV